MDRPEPLLVTTDLQLAEEVEALAAAAGVGLRRATGPAGALREWRAASVVLVGADQAVAMASVCPPRRAGVHLLACGPVIDDLFKIALELGAEDVAELPRSQAWLGDLLADVADERPRHGRVVGVVGGAGGAGATTLACSLAQLAARSGTALVLDADPLGPGADRVLGLDAEPGARWDALSRTTGRLGARSLREAVPRRQGLGVLSWSAGSDPALAPFVLREALAAGRRGHDLVVVDLPRSADELLLEVVPRCDLVLVVVPATVAGIASSARLVARLDDPARLRLVVRGRGVDADAVGRAIRLPIVAELGHQRGLDEAVDLGLGPVRHHRTVLGRAAGEVLTRLQVLGDAA